MVSWRLDWASWRLDLAVLNAFRWYGAFPERTGDVPGGSKTRIIDFSLVLRDLGGGESMGVRGRAMAEGPGLDPQNLKTNQTPLELALTWAVWSLAFHQYSGLGLGCLVFNLHSRRRAKRGGGFS